MKFKRLRRPAAGMLAVFMFLFSPVCDYAGALDACAEVASGSDAGEAGTAAVEGEMPEAEDGEYMPDNIVARYEESFDYCPLTPDDVINPRARIAIADDVVAAIIALLALLGIYVGNNTDLVHQIASGFDTYLRRTAGNVKAVMEVWATVLTYEAGFTISGIKVLLPYLRDYLKSFFTGYGTGALEYSFSTGAGSLTAGPYSVPLQQYIDSKDGLLYCTSFYGSLTGNYICDIAFSDAYGALALYVDSKSTSNVRISLCGIDSNSTFKKGCIFYYGTRTYVPSDGSYKYSDVYTSGNSSVASYYSTSTTDPDGLIQMIANSSILPLFLDVDYAKSYSKYGTLDGLVQPDDDYVFTVPKAWTKLQQDALDRFGNTLTLPASEEEWQALQNQLAAANTADDALAALSGVIDVNSSGGAVGPGAYLSLSYVLDALSVYAGGTALDADTRNGFIRQYLGASGTDINALNTYAQTIVAANVKVTGSDPDNNNNSFLVSLALAGAFLSYLLSAGLIDSKPEAAAGTQVQANVRIAEQAGNPDTPGGTTDLSGVLSVIQAILAAVGGLPGLIASQTISALASSAFASGVTLNLDTIRAGIGQIAQWDFADWSAALGASVLLSLRTFAADFGLDGIAGTLDRIAQWDFADWADVLGAQVLSSLRTAASDFGLSGISGTLDQIAQWDFADWSDVFRTILDTSLAGLGLGAIAGSLADIAAKVTEGKWAVDLSDLKDWIAALPAAIAAAFADTVEAEEEEAEQYQISSIISDKFPFCIPFDLINCVTVLRAEPLQPRWELPFVVDTDFIHVRESVVIDLSSEQWARPVAVIRSMVLLFYIVGLVILTRLLIKG